MQFGAYMFCTDYSVRPDDLARLLEERNFESMWVPEHSHIPASRQSPWPGGGELPREYWHTYDPFVPVRQPQKQPLLRRNRGVIL